jgi:hypothetical protein
MLNEYFCQFNENSFKIFYKLIIYIKEVKIMETFERFVYKFGYDLECLP